MSQTSPPPGGPNRPETDPFTSLRRGMDRLLEQFTGGWGPPGPFESAGVTVPRLDVAETPAGLEVSAELPGVDPKDVAIDLENDMLTIRAERRRDREESDPAKRWHLVERASGTFLRRLALPFEPQPDQVTAAFDKGVLHITLPRPPANRPQSRRIEIRTT